jgi:hypothetical protein
VGSGALQALHGLGIRGGDVPGKARDPPGGGESLDVVGLLDRHGDAVEGARRVAGGDRLVGARGRGERPVEVAHHDRVDLGVVFLDALDVKFGQLA